MMQLVVNYSLVHKMKICTQIVQCDNMKLIYKTLTCTSIIV